MFNSEFNRINIVDDGDDVVVQEGFESNDRNIRFMFLLITRLLTFAIDEDFITIIDDELFDDEGVGDGNKLQQQQ
ncbi:hypothetical protein DERF_006741 [Dermatophagoides farinae]|uniref:Uncharacterized protein n=1 Tax=Dermatophagoides farinae TaxID=6954 RepID=A0A922HXR2_DERFA|nr:hypothetical protein DERF_006741 [Dermatophagoides farinae]